MSITQVCKETSKLEALIVMQKCDTEQSPCQCTVLAHRWIERAAASLGPDDGHVSLSFMLVICKKKAPLNKCSVELVKVILGILTQSELILVLL